MTRQEKEAKGISKHAPKVTRVIVKDLEGNKVGDYPSMKQAAKGIGCSTQCISAAAQRGSVVKKKYILETIAEVMEPRPKLKPGPKGKPCEESRPVVIPRTIHKIEASPESLDYCRNHIPYRTGGKNENIRGNQTE